jgi:D-3-phosphoglycerate dehydrogenase
VSHRILVLEGITERGAEILRAEGFSVDMEKALPPAELVKLVPPYDAILVRSGSQMNAEVIDAARSLKVIGGPASASTTWTSRRRPAGASSS